MSINDVEDKELLLTQKNDPDNCQSKIYIQTLGGCEDVCIEVHGMTSDTREWSGHCIFLDVERINQLYQFLGNHLATLNTVGKSDYSAELDNVIEEEMKNKPKDIMK